MPTEWKLETGAATYTAWVRSWRQEIETPLGLPPVLTAHLEEVRAYDDGHVERSPMGFVTVAMAGLADQDLADAATVQAILTRLIGDQVTASQAPAVPTECPQTAE